VFILKVDEVVCFVADLYVLILRDLSGPAFHGLLRVGRFNAAILGIVSVRVEIVGDGFLPGAGAEGGGVFVFSHVDGLDHGLGEVGQGVGGFGFDVALGHGGKEVAEGRSEIACGGVFAGKLAGDVLAELLGGAGLSVFARVVGAKVWMGGRVGHTAATSVGEGECTQRDTSVDGERSGHGRAPEFSKI
jgi:hypothetical protein